MVCFDITIAYPYYARESTNKTFDKRIEHLSRHYTANLLGKYIKDGQRYMRFALCDADAVGFLRDVPEPTYCVSIQMLRTGENLYANKKVLWVWTPPPHPRDIMKKQVYWAASQLEKWQPSIQGSTA